MIEQIRNEIRKRGFLSEAQIKVMYNDALNINELIIKLECDDIKSINYTNKYIKSITSKKLFYCIGNK